MTLAQHWFCYLSAFRHVQARPVVYFLLSRLPHGFGHFFDRQTQSGQVLLFGLDFLRVVLVDFLKEFDFLHLEFFQFLFLIFFLFGYFHDILGLFQVKTANFLFPVLHVPFFGFLGVFSDFFLFFFLMGQELSVHFLDFFPVLVRDVLQLASIVQLDQVNSFLDAF